MITIDSNEDGFDEANVRAICSTGESTKANSQGYIGEKGIGFKSVFKVASKVHVQSEPYSFSFEHNYGDSGLGMVTPVFEEFGDLPSGVRTRITLTLARSTDLARLVKDFEDLPDSLLIFLNKLNKLSINVMNCNSKLISDAEYFYTYSDPDRKGLLVKMWSSNGKSNSLIQDFHITKRFLDNLPKDPARPNTNRVEVVLAFPLDYSGSIPVIEQQYVYAFLPVRKAGFSVRENSILWQYNCSPTVVSNPV